MLAAVQDEERTVLISSHGLTDIERFADHLGMIKNGRLLFEGATSDVISRFRIVDFVAADTSVSMRIRVYSCSGGMASAGASCWILHAPRSLAAGARRHPAR